MIDASDRKPWISAVILIGIVYFVIGMVFAALANPASDQERFTWRLAAWVASAIVFATQLGYEHYRLGNSPHVTALHAAMAVAVGAFLLAFKATAGAVMVPSHAPYWRYLLALALWPILTSLPAFLVAFAAATVLAHLPTRRLVE